MIQHSGGRAGPNEFGFINAGYNLNEIEPLRQQLLSQNDVGQVLGKSAQQRLDYYHSQITLEELIRYIRNMPIN